MKTFVLIINLYIMNLTYAEISVICMRNKADNLQLIEFKTSNSDGVSLEKIDGIVKSMQLVCDFAEGAIGCHYYEYIEKNNKTISFITPIEEKNSVIYLGVRLKLSLYLKHKLFMGEVKDKKELMILLSKNNIEPLEKREYKDKKQMNKKEEKKQRGQSYN